MTGTTVAIEFTISDHDARRAERTVERFLRKGIERQLHRRFGRFVVGSPKIRAVQKDVRDSRGVS